MPLTERELATLQAAMVPLIQAMLDLDDEVPATKPKKPMQPWPDKADRPTLNTRIRKRLGGLRRKAMRTMVESWYGAFEFVSGKATDELIDEIERRDPEHYPPPQGGAFGPY